MQRESRNILKIAIVSDSHRKLELLKEAIDIIKDEKCDFLIHAGDIVIEDALKLIEKSKIPYQAVFGNNDAELIKVKEKYNIEKEPFYFNIKNIKVKLMHLPFYLNNDADMIVFGHTHFFEAEEKKGSLYINPGEICARKKPISEFAIVEEKKDEWKVSHYQKNLNLNEKRHTVNKVLKFKR